MKVLVDTSVWIGHFKRRNSALVGLLEEGFVVCHPHVVVEVACGTPPRRGIVLELLNQLEQLPVATNDELLILIESRNLFGKGCGLVDVSLVASASMAGDTRIWSLDKSLDAMAGRLGLSYQPNDA